MTQTNINDLNPYLHGLYAPIKEEVSVDKLKVEGEIPRDLHGAYFRNGPNPQTPPQGMHHWFDGDGMVHGIWFENGEARYRNRYIGTQDFQANGNNSMPGIFEPSRTVAGRRCPEISDKRRRRFCTPCVRASGRRSAARSKR